MKSQTVSLYARCHNGGIEPDGASDKQKAVFYLKWRIKMNSEYDILQQFSNSRTVTRRVKLISEMNS